VLGLTPRISAAALVLIPVLMIWRLQVQRRKRAFRRMRRFTAALIGKLARIC